MRTRHRTPTIFSLSMVDVLCCALGCVLLLWLWNLRKAQDFQYETEEKARLLAATARDKGDLDKELAREDVASKAGKPDAPIRRNALPDVYPEQKTPRE